MAISFDAKSNFAYSTVATAPVPAASGTSLIVAAGEGTKFPATPFNAVIWPTGVQPTTANAEVVRVTNIATDTFTITRAQESSAARTIVVGDQIALNVTAKTLTDIQNAFSTASQLTCPIGTIMMWPTGVGPTGWFTCDGTPISRATYSALFAVIGTTFGAGDGSTTFNLPDFRQRLPIGRAASGSLNTIGATAGSWDHTHGPGTLTVASHTHTSGTLAVASHTHGAGTLQVASHTHGAGTLTVAAHTHSDGTYAADSDGAHTHTGTTATGGSHTHATATGGGSLATSGGDSLDTHAGHTHTFTTDSGGAHTHGISGSSGSATPAVDAGVTATSAPLVDSGATGATAPSVTSGSTGATAPAVTSGVTDAGNPPVMAINFMIRATLEI
jgi:microcystin-dependent protein